MESELPAARSVRSDSNASTSAHSATSTMDSDTSHLRTHASQEDDDVMVAIQALGILRHSNSNSLPASSSVSSNRSQSITGTSPSTGASTPALSEIGVEIEREDPKKFISRVSALSLVSGGLEWYERSKSSSKVVKYGAGLMESSLSAVSRPLVNSLQLGQLDDFACRQLDRLAPVTPKAASPKFKHDILDSNEEHNQRTRKRNLGEKEEKTFVDDEVQQAVVLQANQNDPASGAVAVVSRSRWQTVLLEAGGLGAAVSEESLKSLRYCLQWLLYATAHLDHQITVLRDFIDSLHRHHSNDSRSDALITASASAHLTQIKCDVVDTIRKVVDVVSKYAGVALPDQAKNYVRQSILGLPVKWASAVEVKGRGRSVSVTSSVGERMDSPAQSRHNQGGEEASTSHIAGAASNPALRPTEDAAERVLTFAVESLDMLKSVTQIFGDSVEKAEAWIERLRIVGLDRQRERRAAQNSNERTSGSPTPPPEGYAIPGKRRRAIGPEGEKLNSLEADGLLRRKTRRSQSQSMEVEMES